MGGKRGFIEVYRYREYNRDSFIKLLNKFTIRVLEIGEIFDCFKNV